jgi:hypothetical protein
MSRQPQSGPKLAIEAAEEADERDSGFRFVLSHHVHYRALPVGDFSSRASSFPMAAPASDGT